ncbi:Uncharacterized protein CT_538 [Chlamydiales bacterium SCGC AG-110-M15]|nr:Uncharacterized protein CT_538 [Chlamydiales bacterium SCGC AG-110-M15]
MEFLMTKVVISEDSKSFLTSFLRENPKVELVAAYLYYVERKFDLSPVAFPKGKTIYRSAEDAVSILESQDELWRETQLKISVGTEAVNDNTVRIYICPFTGKVYGNNTHPNPQDAIYDWVSKCPENTERVDGLRVKRFFVSDDPDVIKTYRSKKKKTIDKVVYSSAITGKLFHSKGSIIEDFVQNHLKEMTLLEVQSQNRFEIEPGFLDFLQNQLSEERITSFVEALAEIEEFIPFVEQWVEGDEE